MNEIEMHQNMRHSMEQCLEAFIQVTGGNFKTFI
jgi:hypothetical protein